MEIRFEPTRKQQSPVEWTKCKNQRLEIGGKTITSWKTGKIKVRKGVGEFQEIGYKVREQNVWVTILPLQWFWVTSSKVHYGISKYKQN